MNAKKCDRCGEYYIPDRIVKMQGVVVREPNGYEKRLDLCNCCENALKDWIEAYKEREEK